MSESGKRRRIGIGGEVHTSSEVVNELIEAADEQVLTKWTARNR